MAKCKNCNTDVGCGCNLKGGLCASCREIATQEKPKTNIVIRAIPPKEKK